MITLVLTLAERSDVTLYASAIESSFVIYASRSIIAKTWVAICCNKIGRYWYMFICILSTLW